MATGTKVKRGKRTSKQTLYDTYHSEHEHFLKYVPGFAILPYNSQKQYLGVCLALYWQGDRNEHKTYEGYYKLPYTVLEKHFGKEKNGGKYTFSAVNAICKQIEVISDWSLREGRTKPHRLTEECISTLDDLYEYNQFLAEERIMRNGRRLTDKVGAIASRDAYGNHAKHDCSTLKLAVPVNIEALIEGRNALKRLLDHHRKPNLVGDLIPTNAYQRFVKAHFEEAKVPTAKVEDWIKRRLQQVIGFIKDASMTNFVGDVVPQQYEESLAGRLYGQGRHLQTCTRLVRTLALWGCYDYDLENCHYSILYQLSQQLDKPVTVPYMAEYIKNKKRFRTEVMLAAGITKDQAKTCITSLIYGSRLSLRSDDEGDPIDAIAAEVGLAKAEVLFKFEKFRGLYEDVKNIRLPYIKQVKRQQSKKQGNKGLIVNAMGKGVPEDGSIVNPETGEKERVNMLSHLLQGIEARMLAIAMEVYRGKILLLCHDGFIVNDPINTRELEQAIRQEMGFKMRLSGETLGSL